MAKKNNVKPGQYKIKGRDRQGEDILQDDYKQQYAQAETRRGSRENVNRLPLSPVKE